MSNHPIPPERIRVEAERVVNEWGMKYSETGMWQGRSVLSQDRFVALVAAGVSLVDVATVQREAVKKFVRAYGIDDEINVSRFSNRYLAATYPAPAPRECVVDPVDDFAAALSSFVANTAYRLAHDPHGEVGPNERLALKDMKDALKQFAERAK